MPNCLLHYISASHEGRSQVNRMKVGLKLNMIHVFIGVILRQVL